MHTFKKTHDKNKAKHMEKKRLVQGNHYKLKFSMRNDIKIERENMAWF